MERYLVATELLDFEHPSLQELVRDRDWLALDDATRIAAVYKFVRDEIPFGYNASDDVPASGVLADGYGQCNTKTTLLMALLRAVGVPARFHGATIHKRLQQGVVRGLLYRIAPQNIIHSWAEVWFEGRWVGLEGVILDASYSTVSARSSHRHAEASSGTESGRTTLRIHRSSGAEPTLQSRPPESTATMACSTIPTASTECMEPTSADCAHGCSGAGSGP